MLVSIITPTYNAANYIRDTIFSVQLQTHRNWEMIIVDDCSTDDTQSIVAEIAKNDNRVRLISLANNGGSAVARNKGLDCSTGDFLAFLDADDLWLPEKLQKQLDFMKLTNSVFCFTAYELIDTKGNLLDKVIDTHGPPSVDYMDMLKKRATLGCSTVMLDWNQLSKYRMPLIRTGQDYGLWLRILKGGNNAYCLQEILTQYRIVPGSISRNKFKKSLRQWQIYREIENLPFLQSFWFFLHYAFRAITR
jgi:teichuronic acid biosynthesis glycosyltransferase TuaG